MIVDNDFFLTIGIISYNRPIELRRTLESLLPLPFGVEVLVCDDNSPKIFEIKSQISEILLNNPCIKFVENEVNLGYDKNLFNVIELSNTKYIILLGDDDYLEFGAIENLILFINNNKNFNCGFLRFKSKVDEKYRRFYFSNTHFNKDIVKTNGSFIYNSILFSGLIFNREVIINNKSLFLKYFNSIYIQVALFIFSSSLNGTFYISGPGVIIGGDGESGFGFNDASKNLDADLKDRSSILSNISYHKRLFDVLKKVKIDLDLNILKPFILEYKIRSVKSLFIARKYGRNYLSKYWNELKSLEIKSIWMLFPVYLVLYIFPSFFLAWPIYVAEAIINMYRILKSKIYNVKIF